MISIREIVSSDIPLLLDYWYGASDEFLRGMGVDVAKMPDKPSFGTMLEKQMFLDYDQKPSYALILDIDGEPSGHTNINEIEFGVKAKMHLHLWKSDQRKGGLGTKMIALALPYFFKNMQLQELYCEPYSANIAPNKTLEKVGFEKVKTYITTPGFINFEQEVYQWLMTKERFERVYL